MVMSRRSNGRSWLDEFIVDEQVTIAAITPEVARLAADAFQRFGKGTGHKAQLNFGDCLSYAVAKSLDAPLLFKGEDFRHTDVKSAL